MPALHSLACEGLLPAASRVVGVARTPLSDQTFCNRLYQGVDGYARLKSKPGICELWLRFAERHSYLMGSYNNPETHRRLAERLEQLNAEAGTQGNRLFYLATPPALFPVIIEQLGRVEPQRPGLDAFQGESRFTTWAHKIAVRVAFASTEPCMAICHKPPKRAVSRVGGQYSRPEHW